MLCGRLRGLLRGLLRRQVLVVMLVLMRLIATRMVLAAVRVVTVDRVTRRSMRVLLRVRVLLLVVGGRMSR